MFRSPVPRSPVHRNELHDEKENTTSYGNISPSRTPLSPKRGGGNTPSKMPFPEKVAMFNAPKPRQMKLFGAEDFQMSKSSKKRNREDDFVPDFDKSLKKRVSGGDVAEDVYDITDIRIAVNHVLGGALDKVDRKLEKMKRSYDDLFDEVKLIQNGRENVYTDVKASQIGGGSTEALDEQMQEWMKRSQMKKILSKTVERLQTQKEVIEETRSQIFFKFQTFEAEVDMKLKDQTKVNRKLKKWVKEKYDGILKTISTLSDSVIGSNVNAIVLESDAKKLVSRFQEELSELKHEKQAFYREMDNLIDREKEEIRQLRKEREEQRVSYEKNISEMKAEREKLNKEYKSLTKLVDQEKNRLQKLRETAEEEDKINLIHTLDSELTKSTKKKIFKKKKKPKKVPVRKFELSQYIAAASSRRASKSSQSDDSLMPPPKLLPRSQLLTPPTNKSYSRIGNLFSPETIRTPKDKTWGAKQVSIEKYYFNDTAEACEVDDGLVRKWVKTENLLKHLETQKHINPRAVFGQARRTNLNLREVFKAYDL